MLREQHFFHLHRIRVRELIKNILCGLAKLELQKNARLASSKFNVKGKQKLKIEIPKNEVKADAMDTERHKLDNIFALSHLIAEVCRGYGD